MTDSNAQPLHPAITKVSVWSGPNQTRPLTTLAQGGQLVTDLSNALAALQWAYRTHTLAGLGPLVTTWRKAAVAASMLGHAHAPVWETLIAEVDQLVTIEQETPGTVTQGDIDRVEDLVAHHFAQVSLASLRAQRERAAHALRQEGQGDSTDGRISWRPAAA